MAFSPQFREPPPGLPTIITPGFDHLRNRQQHEMPFSRSSAMSIPGNEVRDDVPPPLPPPRILPMEGAPYPPFDLKERREHEHGFRSGMSAYGSTDSSYHEDRPSFSRRNTASTNGDEGYASYSTDRSRESFPSEFGLFHTKLQIQSPADMFSDSMKKRLDPIRMPDRSPPGSLSTHSDIFPRRNPLDSRFPLGHNLPLQLPIHSRPSLDSPSRLTDTSIFSASSPRSAPFSYSPSEQRSPRDMSDVNRSPPRNQGMRKNSDDINSEYHGVEDMEIDDLASLKRMHMEDDQGSARNKRRVASPPQDDYATRGTAGLADVVRRREPLSRGSPTPRLYTPTPSLSMPVAASRSNSNISTASSAPLSTINTANSFGHHSPGAVSPGDTSPTDADSPPYHGSPSLATSPRGSEPGLSPLVSNASRPKTPGDRPSREVSKPHGSKLQDFFMCECCPKKPKRFETVEELKSHAAEKQYGCNYCGNRFKNKNEAERHQNSLHVRRHSWSCAALSGYDKAFHDSPNMPGEADVCGYCGEEFHRTGQASGSGALSSGDAPMHATDQDWEDRIEHLQVVHKFRECNSSKKFFRADHFRQHLKHSHAGFSGKWTNMLENACMIEEEPPTPI